jgi:hypothetical protein
MSPSLLHVYHVDPSGASTEWAGGDRWAGLLGLFAATARREPTPDVPLHEALVASERQLLNELRTITPDERERGVRHAVVPLLAAVVTA